MLIRNKDSEQIMLRDFNLYHPHWGRLDAHLDERAEHLILIAEEFAIEQALPVGTVTYEENCQTTIDLVFTTPAITAGVVRCDIDHSLNSGSDHLPILTQLELEIVEAIPDKRRNFQKIDIKRLTSTLSERLISHADLQRPISSHADWTKEEINSQITAIIESI